MAVNLLTVTMVFLWGDEENMYIMPNGLYLAYRKNETQDPERTQDLIGAKDPMKTQDPSRIQDPRRTQDPNYPPY